MSFQVVGPAVWADLATEIGELLGDLPEGPIELNVLALDCKDSTRLRAPSKHIDIAVISIEGPTKQARQLNFLLSLPSKLSHSGCNGGVERETLHTICTPDPFAHLGRPSLRRRNLSSVEPSDLTR